MPRDPASTNIYHITDIANLPSIIARGGLISDARIAQAGGPLTQIGYDHIKSRRLTELRVDCCNNSFVGEFVPFYYCPRSIMLYTVNRGNTGRPAGCQETILHLVSTVATASNLGRQWAMSDGNAGARAAAFSCDINALDQLNWTAIGARYWSEVSFEKQAEFLVHDSFPMNAFYEIGCNNDAVTQQVKAIVAQAGLNIQVKTVPAWYY